jgi:hypothetical protein
MLESAYGYDHVLLYARDTSATTLGPVRYRVSAPGFVAAEAQLWLDRLREKLPVHEIRIERLPGVRLGEVVLQVVGRRSAGLWAPSDSAPLGTLRLRPRDPAEGYRTVYRCPIIPDENESMRITGVPYGSYDVDFKGNAFYAFPETGMGEPSLHVGPAPATWVLDWSRLSFAVIELRDDQDKKITGHVTIMVKARAGEGIDGIASWGFDDEPYVVDGLVAGRFRFKARLDQETRLGPRYTELAESPEIVVDTGQTIHVVLGPKPTADGK